MQQLQQMQHFQQLQLQLQQLQQYQQPMMGLMGMGGMRMNMGTNTDMNTGMNMNMNPLFQTHNPVGMMGLPFAASTASSQFQTPPAMMMMMAGMGVGMGGQPQPPTAFHSVPGSSFGVVNALPAALASAAGAARGTGAVGFPLRMTSPSAGPTSTTTHDTASTSTSTVTATATAQGSWKPPQPPSVLVDNSSVRRVRMYMTTDDESLSPFQCYARQHMELFEAQQVDVQTGAQGRYVLWCSVLHTPR